MPWISWILLLQLALAAYLAGLVWLVQVVHYPMLSDLDPARAGEACQRHARLITPVVGPAMVLEAIIAVFLLSPGEWWGHGGTNPGRGLPWSGAAAVLLLWLSTFFVQVPLHARLAAQSGEVDIATVRLLVRTNWVRTVLWSVRVCIAAAMLIPYMKPEG